MAGTANNYASPTYRSTIRFHEGGLSDDSSPFNSQKGIVGPGNSSQLVNHAGGLAAPEIPVAPRPTSSHQAKHNSTLVNSSTGLGALGETYVSHSSGDHTLNTKSSISQSENGLEGTQDSNDNLLILHQQFGEGEVDEHVRPVSRRNQSQLVYSDGGLQSGAGDKPCTRGLKHIYPKDSMDEPDDAVQPKLFTAGGVEVPSGRRKKPGHADQVTETVFTEKPEHAAMLYSSDNNRVSVRGHTVLNDIHHGGEHPYVFEHHSNQDYILSTLKDEESKNNYGRINTSPRKDPQRHHDRGNMLLTGGGPSVIMSADGKSQLRHN